MARMDPVDELRRRGGVARTRTILDAGVSPHALRRAREAGTVTRPRNGWLALPDADRLAVGAAARGVLISCLTLAARRGLWVPDARCIHVAARPHSSRFQVPEGTVVHWSAGIVPRHSDAVEDDLCNALVLVARCQPRETARVVWESALNRQLVDRLALQRLPLPSAARAVLEQARPYADSGLETIVIHRLGWLRVPMLPQAWILGHRVDLLVGDRLIVQLDGATHTGEQRTRDITHDALLTLQGYHVLRFSYEPVMHQWPHVQQIITEAIAQGLHRAAR